MSVSISFRSVKFSSMKNIHQKIGLLFVSLLLCSCTKTTSIRRHPDFHIDLDRSKNVAVLPPVVEAVTVEASGKTKRNYDYEAMVEDLIIESMQPKLKDLGYRNVKFLNRRAIHDYKLSGKVLSLREQYNEKIASLYKVIDWKHEDAHNIGAFMSPQKDLADILGVDLIVLVEYHLRAKSSGACAKDFALSLFNVGGDSNPSELLSLRLAVINLHNGNLVWSNFNRTGYGTFSGIFSKNAYNIEKSRLKDEFNTLLENFPKH